MRDDKHEANRLRKQGKSYREITKILGVPKSTLTSWFKDVMWSRSVKLQLLKSAREKARERMKVLAGHRRLERVKVYREKRQRAAAQFQQLKKDQLFVAGLAIYWSEGDSNLFNGRIRIANSDPLMLRCFYRFLKKYLPEVSEKAKVYLILYPEHSDESCRRHWSKQVGIPLGRFIKSQYIQGRSSKKKLVYGIGNILISSRAYKEVIIEWVDHFKKEVNNI